MFFCGGRKLLERSFLPPTPLSFKNFEERGFIFCVYLCVTCFLLCHPERNEVKSKSEQREDQMMQSIVWDLSKKDSILFMRSRFAPSLRSGSTTKTSPRDVFFAQDDTNTENKAKRISPHRIFQKIFTNPVYRGIMKLPNKFHRLYTLSSTYV